MVQSQDLNASPTVILTGPTAVGKSSLAIEVAQKFDLEIINADSVCFYREFNIGSAKPSLEEMNQIRHHLVNVADPNDTYHAGQFYRDCTAILSDIHARGKKALIVGGSGFYLKALRMGLWEAPASSPEFRKTLEDISTPHLFEKLIGIDMLHAQKIGANDRYRMIRALEIFELSGKRPSQLEAEMPSEPDSRFQLWVVDREKEELTQRMHLRIQQMIDQGLIDETKILRANYPDSKTLHAVGYQQVLDYLDAVKPEGRKLAAGEAGLIEEIELSHRQLAKQQRTWFKNLKVNESFVLDQDRAELIEKLMKLYQK
jgi:tRNA dimethylallyltransferase